MTEKDFTSDIIQFCDKYEHVFLYGAGFFGKAFYEYLTLNNKKIEGFIVSDNQFYLKNVNGLNIYCVSSIPFNHDECGIILSVNDKYFNEVTYSLLRNQINNIFFPSNTDRLIAERIIELKHKGVDIYSRDLDFKKFKLANLLIKGDKSVINGLAYELPDLVYPLLNDYSKINEGTYEYGNVILRPQDVVFDCGANIGLFSAYAAELNCKVYAFEPTTSVIPFLELTQKLYPNNLFIEPFAVADYNGKTEFVCYEDTISNFMVNQINTFRNTNGTKTIEVPVISIDSFINENNISRVDFIKSDIEGAERLMIKGAKDVLKEFGPKLSICTYHLPDDIDVLPEIILEANPKYKIIHRWKKLYAWIE